MTYNHHRLLYLLTASLCLLCLVIQAMVCNIHTVIPGKLYRSGQLPVNALLTLVHRQKIRTVINLRGKNSGRKWYRDERALAKTLGLKYLDVALNATHPPSAKQLQQLAKWIVQAKKPILAHCQGGVDRTGLASALALALLTHGTINQARTAFSIRYGLTHARSIGPRLLKNYKQWLQQRLISHSPSALQRWLAQYQPNAL